VKFYQKYRVPILITTGILTSFVVSIAIDRIMVRRIKKKLEERKKEENTDNKQEIKNFKR
jgi:hydrogenase-4 membrane subunit HyfE